MFIMGTTDLKSPVIMSLHTHKQVLWFCNWIKKEKGAWKRRQKRGRSRSKSGWRAGGPQGRLPERLTGRISGGCCLPSHSLPGPPLYGSGHVDATAAKDSSARSQIQTPELPTGRSLAKGWAAVPWTKTVKELPRALGPGQEAYDTHQLDLLNMEK